MDSKYLKEFLQNSEYIFEKLINPGLLLVTGSGLDYKNIMTIGWMQIGYVWREMVVSIAIRPSRYSYKLLNEHDEFTVNVMPEELNKAVQYCGAQSGAYTDKFNELNLHAVNSIKIQAASIKESEMVIECKTLHKSRINPQNLSDLVLARYYSKEDYHDIIIARIENFIINKKNKG